MKQIARIARGELVTPESNVWMMLRPDDTYVETRRWATPEEKPTPTVRAYTNHPCFHEIDHPNPLPIFPPWYTQMTFLAQLLKQVQFQLARSLLPPWLIRNLPFAIGFTCYRREQVSWRFYSGTTVD